MAGQCFKRLAHDSTDLVLAAHFNNYGTRLVTGCADHRIRVFDLDESTGWQMVDVWRGHNGEVLDVSSNDHGKNRVATEIGVRSNGMVAWLVRPWEVSAKISNSRFGKRIGLRTLSADACSRISSVSPVLDPWSTLL